MAKKTNISWTDATWNIARGCTKVGPDCKYCYMYRDSNANTRYNPMQVVRTKTVFNFPLKYKETKSACWDGAPLIFTSSLTDWAHEQIDSYRNEMWDIIRKRPDLIFQLLTKRPERLPDILPADWGAGYPNVWLGTSIGSQESIGRLQHLLSVPARLRFLSIEPLHGEVDLLWPKDLFPDGPRYCCNGYMCGCQGRPIDPPLLAGIDWVIVGGESGNDRGKYSGYRRCLIEWIDHVVLDCKYANVPVFVKQLGTYIAKQWKLKAQHGTDIEEFPEHLRLRQFPVPAK